MNDKLTRLSRVRAKTVDATSRLSPAVEQIAQRHPVALFVGVATLGQAAVLVSERIASERQ